MDHLEVPQPLARPCVERDERVAEQIRAVPVGAVEVVSRRAGGKENDAALGIDGELAPCIGAADVFPGIRRPGVVAEFTGMRDGVEPPRLFAGDDVVRANVAGRREVALAGRGAEDDQVLEDLSRIRRLDPCERRGIPRVALFEVDRAVRSEREDRLPGPRIDRLEVVVALEQQPAVLSIAALPVVDAARRNSLQVGVNPDFSAGRRVECDQRGVSSQHVGDAVDDERTEVVRQVVVCRVGPRGGEPRQGLSVDLIELDVAGVIRTSPIVVPGGPLQSGLAVRAGADSDHRGRDGDEQRAPAGQGPC